MDIFTIDVESYWSQTYSLTKMSPLEYVLGDEFETVSCSIKLNDYPTDVFFGHDNVAKAFKSIAAPLANSLLIAHNMSGFDAYVAHYVFGLKPKMWGCTLAMARPLHTKTVGLSLAKLVQHYGLGVKNNAVLMQTRGKHLADFTPAELEDMKTYNRADTDQCYALFKRLRPSISAAEMWQIDALTRMRVEPKFEVDIQMLEVARGMERHQKQTSVLRLAQHLRKSGFASEQIGVTTTVETLEEAVRVELASAPKFAALLESLGVTVPMKPSPTGGGKQIHALAKTDEAFTDLQQHDNPIVAAAARARLAVKSTLLETRIDKFLTAASLTSGMLPVPLRYCGADTTGRDSGEEYNCQNLPRIGGTAKISDALRNCMKAPKGFRVIVADQSGIELRVNHFLWKVQSSMELYAANPEADLYKAFAAARYKKLPEDVTKPERQLAKVAQLGLGFGAGWKTFLRVAKTMGGLDLTDDESEGITDAWRNQYAEIVRGWKLGQAAMGRVHAGSEVSVDPWGMVTTCAEGLRLPSGRMIRYPDLRQEEGAWPDGRVRQEWVYGSGRYKSFMHGGKVVENCIAEGTQVLTHRGWVSIQHIQADDQIHDGVEFVPHGGMVYKSVQPCVTIDGVFMTSDHEVLTDEGWKSASQNPEPYRPSIRLPDGDKPRAQRWEKTKLALSVSVRTTDNQSWNRREQGSKTWGHSELRMPDSYSDTNREQDARYVTPPGIRGLQVDDRSLQVEHTSVLGQLRRAGDHCMRGVGMWVSSVLVRHGAYVCVGVGAGPKGQQRRVFSGKLPVGTPQDEYYEQEKYRGGGHTRTKPSDGDWTDYALQQAEVGMASESTDPRSVTEKQVFDIVNCGPRQRFVVLGDCGPFIVHNCVQALARDSIFDCSIDFYKSTRMRPALRVHDELVYVVPEPEAVSLLAELQRVMRTPPRWWPELIVHSEGDHANSYGAAK